MSNGRSLRSGRILRLPLIFSLVVVFALLNLPTSRAATSSISGVAFEDLDQDGAFDAGEDVMQGHVIYLFKHGAFAGQATTDAAGRYGFDALEPARYEVAYDASSWAPIKMELVPTTTGSVFPRHTLDVTSAVAADFGWRPITWSTNPDAPIASIVAPIGLRVQTYNDAVAPQEIVDAVMAGTVGAEAASVVIRFALGSTSATSTGVVDRGGVYEDFQATSAISYEAWLTTAAYTVSHEYGHAWSWYHAYMTQHDPTMSAYLSARGLAGDLRVGSSYAWGVGEMIAEDYRQLLGAPAGRSAPQANRDIPPAAEVPGLADFLANIFTRRPLAPTPSPSPTPTTSPESPASPAPEPTSTIVDILGLAVTPIPVKRSATFEFALSTPARVTVVVFDGFGNTVRTLLSGASEPAGVLRLSWDRTNAKGRKVRAGEYTVKVRAENATGWDTAFATFPVV